MKQKKLKNEKPKGKLMEAKYNCTILKRWRTEEIGEE